MKILMVLAALIGFCLLICLLIQPHRVQAQGADFCQQFIGGSRFTLEACIQDLREKARFAAEERTGEVVGLWMSNKDLTDSVKGLQRSVGGIEKKTDNVDLDELDIKLLGKRADDLQDRVKYLEDMVHDQKIILDAQHEQIEILQKEVDLILRVPVKKPKAP
jgi:hypothetical protein